MRVSLSNFRLTQYLQLAKQADCKNVCHSFNVRHNLPPTPALRDSKPTDPIQELALRVVVELPGWEMHVMGTATLIGGHLAITAKHVLEAVVRNFGAKQVPNGVEVSEHALRLYQVLPGPAYRIGNVFRAWICPTDIAILHLGLDGYSGPEKIEWRTPLLRMVPPPAGQKVLAFGYRESKIEVSEGANGVHHIVLNDVGTTGDAYPRGVEYPMIDLALDKIIHAVGLEELDPQSFPGRKLPSA